MPSLPPEILRLARAHRREYAALEGAARRALDRQWDRALEALKAELLDPRTAPYRRGVVRVLLLTLTAGRAQTEGAMERVLAASLEAASAQGAAHAGAEVAAWLEHYGLEARPVNVAAAARLAQGLVAEQIPASVARWGSLGSAAVRGVISQSALTRQSWEETTDSVASALGARRWQAQRIVRTELSTAYHAGHLRTLEQAQADLGTEVKKTAIIVRDLRTAPDSLPMDGQVRALDELFVDGRGRQFLSPPGRPNDREKQVAWLDEPDQA